MEIRTEKFILELSHNELWSIACDIRNRLIDTIKTHWVHYQDSWKTHESERLQMVKKMFMHLGRIDMYDDVIETATNEFNNFNSKQQI